MVMSYPCRQVTVPKTITEGRDLVIIPRDEYETLLKAAKFCQNILEGPAKDCYDYANWGTNANLIYEALVAGLGVSNLRFCTQIYPNAKNLEYCIFCGNSLDLFGCIGLRNKQHCILNKQYSKEKYYELWEKVVAHMNASPYIDRAGRVYRYGEFFPPEFSYMPYYTTLPTNSSL